MKKIYLYLFLAYSVSFYANDTITAISLKNRNLREQGTIDSKILAKIKTNDTLKLTSFENDWVKVIYKDSLNGYVENEFLKIVKNYQAEISELEKMKLFFFEVLFLVSILFFGLLYLLKTKSKFFKNKSIISLIFRSMNIGSIVTLIILLYFYYHRLSFFKIVGIIIFVFVLLYILFWENFRDDISEKEFLKDENTKATTIDSYIFEINSNLKELNKKYNQNENEIFQILVEEFGQENSQNLVTNLIPIVGMPYELVIHYFGEPEKINESLDSNNLWQTFFYDKINNRGNDGIWRLKLRLLNNILEKYEIR